MATRNIKYIVGFLVLPLFLLSCDPNRLYEENRAVDNCIWKSSERLSFEVAIPDTVLRYNVYLNVRNAMEYPYSNLYLFLQTVFPDGRIARDTIECTLADYDGRWLGSGVGSVKFNRFLLQNGVTFRQKGIYRFELEQAMRVNELKGIQDIGLRIEKNE